VVDLAGVLSFLGDFLSTLAWIGAVSKATIVTSGGSIAGSLESSIHSSPLVLLLMNP
jgi:hypothetical protein